MIKAIIFDLDGVICSTDEYHYLAWKEMADSIGVYFDKTINNRLRGVSRMASLDIILERHEGKPFTEEEKVALASKKNEIYRSLLANMTPADLSPVVKSTLDDLRAKGLLLAIGSSSKNTKFILERLGLGGYFDKISDGNNITKSKPDPEVFLKAAEYLGLTSADCMVVEDAYAGVDAAIDGGFICSAIGDASKYERATYRINTFDELLGIADKNM